MQTNNNYISNSIKISDWKALEVETIETTVYGVETLTIKLDEYDALWLNAISVDFSWFPVGHCFGYRGMNSDAWNKWG